MRLTTQREDFKTKMGDYTKALRELVEPLGFVPVHRSYACDFGRLRQPTHRCNSDDCYSGTNRTGEVILDHREWLRAIGTDLRRPWALLSQTYYWDDKPETVEDIDDFCRRHDLTWRDLGPAPYGHGTEALLLLGAQVC